MNTDPIADLLTRIRNAFMARQLVVEAPHSSLKEGIVEVLKRYEFIDSYETVGEGVNKKLVIELGYDVKGEPRVQKIIRVSKPSLRKYVKAKEIGFIRGGFGIGIYSTSKGIKSDQEAKKEGLGGEFLAKVW
jgi:small subunit ribosomal protein S8